MTTANDNVFLYYVCQGCGKTSCTLKTLEQHMGESCQPIWKGNTEAIKASNHRMARQWVVWTKTPKPQAKWTQKTATKEEETQYQDEEQKLTDWYPGKDEEVWAAEEKEKSAAEGSKESDSEDKMDID